MYENIFLPYFGIITFIFYGFISKMLYNLFITILRSTYYKWSFKPVWKLNLNLTIRSKKNNKNFTKYLVIAFKTSLKLETTKFSEKCFSETVAKANPLKKRYKHGRYKDFYFISLYENSTLFRDKRLGHNTWATQEHTKYEEIKRFVVL